MPSIKRLLVVAGLLVLGSIINHVNSQAFPLAFLVVFVLGSAYINWLLLVALRKRSFDSLLDRLGIYCLVVDWPILRRKNCRCFDADVVRWVRSGLAPTASLCAIRYLALRTTNMNRGEPCLSDPSLYGYTIHHAAGLPARRRRRRRPSRVPPDSSREGAQPSSVN